MAVPLPQDEVSRLDALHAYGILDTPAETGFEHLTSLLTRLFRVPVAAVTLVDAQRQWFKSVRGMDLQETPRDQSFCAHAMWGNGVMIVPDTILDPRFRDNPLVTGKPGLRFYAGAPLRTPEGHPLGALCVLDYQPRDFKPAEQELLIELASLAEDELLLRRVGMELRAEIRQRQEAQAALDDAGTPVRVLLAQEGHFRQLVEQASDAMFVYGFDERILDVNTAACEAVGYTRGELLRLRVGDIDVGFDPVKGPKRWKEMVSGEAMTVESLHRRKDGSVFAAEARISVVETGEDRVLLALVRDVTQRKNAEKHLQARAQQQQAVARFGARALGENKTEALLDEAVAVVAGTLGLEICRVLEHVKERKEMVTRAGVNLPPRERGGIAASDSRRFTPGFVMHANKPVIIRDYREEKRFAAPPWAKAAGAVSGLTVPIGEADRRVPRYGVLAACAGAAREFSEDDVYFVQAVANILASAIARIRGEDALRVVEARYHRIAANTPGVVYQYQLHPGGAVSIPFISESCRTFYGMEPHEIQARPGTMLECIHAEDQPGLRAAMHAAETTLVPLHWQGRHCLPTGEMRWVRLDSRPERLADGSVICDGMLIDVTEEVRREQALRQSEERFRLAILHSPFPIMLHADDGEILQVNDSWTHQTGYSSAELATMEEWLERAHASAADRDETRAFIGDLLQYIGATERPARHIRCRGGEERIWDCSHANLGRLPDGRWLHISTAMDVTERHRAEAELRHAKEEAERANDAKGVFLSRMSHELRTPLNAILGFGQLLELGQLNEQDALSVQYILKGGRHLLGLIDEVLDLARIDADEIGLTLAALSPEKLVQDCTGLVARMAQTRGITCTVKRSAAARIPVRADGQRLRQVLLNLLGNAIKYNREGGQVLLSCQQTAANRIRLNVRDTGPGISPEGLALLFVPFERLGQEHGEVEGTGLGLVVAQRLMAAMGGTLGVESRLGQGSTFWVELPVAGEAVAAEVAEVAARQASFPPGKGPDESAPASLLYIEDNASNVQTMAMVIARLRPHWRFLSARTGRSGLEQAREHRPQIILLDLQLPGMSGDEVLIELRADPRTARVPVLLLSADATAHSRKRLLAMGANDYLPKPFNIAGLLEKIDVLLLAVQP